jgi:hypothetical protein
MHHLGFTVIALSSPVSLNFLNLFSLPISPNFSDTLSLNLFSTFLPHHLYLFQDKEVPIITTMRFLAQERMPGFSRPLQSVRYGFHG